MVRRPGRALPPKRRRLGRPGPRSGYGDSRSSVKPADLDDVNDQRYADAEAMTHTIRRLTGLLVPEDQWRSLAACRSADPELFFPVSSSDRSMTQVAEAKAICAGCQVRRECLAFAFRTNQAHGVWGGLSEQERYPIPAWNEHGLIQLPRRPSSYHRARRPG